MLIVHTAGMNEARLISRQLVQTLFFIVFSHSRFTWALVSITVKFSLRIGLFRVAKKSHMPEK